MRESRYSDELRAAAIREAELGTPVAEIVSKLGISEELFAIWQKFHYRDEENAAKFRAKFRKVFYALARKSVGLLPPRRPASERDYERPSAALLPASTSAQVLPATWLDALVEGKYAYELLVEVLWNAVYDEISELVNEFLSSQYLRCLFLPVEQDRLYWYLQGVPDFSGTEYEDDDMETYQSLDLGEEAEEQMKIVLGRGLAMGLQRLNMGEDIEHTVEWLWATMLSEGKHDSEGVVALTPIMGARINSRLEPVVIGDMRLERARERDYRLWINSLLSVSDRGWERDPRLGLTAAKCFVSREYEILRAHLGSPLEQIPPAGGDRIIDLESDFLTSLRLAGLNTASMPLTLYIPTAIFTSRRSRAPKHDSRTGGPILWAGDRVTLNSTVLEPIITALPRLANARKNTALRIALTRWNYAFEREREDDAFLDMWIGLEALLGDASSTDSIIHKLQLRIAALIGTDVAEREFLFKQVFDLYSLRSRVVYGEGELKRGSSNQLRELFQRSIVAVLERGPQFVPTDIDKELLA